MADRTHSLLSRSMAPSQEDKDSILGNTYHAHRRQGRKMMKQAGNEAGKERRRAVVSRKQGKLWKVAEERIKRGN